MSVTIKQVAAISGVSRGTVDRVLHNRGRVNEETAQKVLLCARELGYEPNRMGKALAVHKKKHLVGVIVCKNQNPFFDDVLAGISRMEREFLHYGISVQTLQMTDLDPVSQVKLIQQLAEEITGLVITPIDHPSVKEKLNSLDIPIVNLNTDLEATNRIAYVGTDYHKGGKLSGGIVKLLRPNGAEVGIVNGSKKLYGHRLREQGFTEELSKGNYQIFDTVYCEDDDIFAFEVTSKLLKAHPSLNTLFIAAGGVNGACRAVLSQKRSDVTVISFDATEQTIKLVNDDVISVTICQNPHLQGEKAMQIMLDFLVLGQKPETGNYILEHEIKIKQSF